MLIECADTAASLRAMRYCATSAPIRLNVNANYNLKWSRHYADEGARGARVGRRTRRPIVFCVRATVWLPFGSDLDSSPPCTTTVDCCRTAHLCVAEAVFHRALSLRRAVPECAQ